VSVGPVRDPALAHRAAATGRAAQDVVPLVAGGDQQHPPGLVQRASRQVGTSGTSGGGADGGCCGGGGNSRSGVGRGGGGGADGIGDGPGGAGGGGGGQHGGGGDGPHPGRGRQPAQQGRRAGAAGPASFEPGVVGPTGLATAGPGPAGRWAISTEASGLIRTRSAVTSRPSRAESRTGSSRCSAPGRRA